MPVRSMDMILWSAALSIAALTDIIRSLEMLTSSSWFLMTLFNNASSSRFLFDALLPSGRPSEPRRDWLPCSSSSGTFSGWGLDNWTSSVGGALLVLAGVLVGFATFYFFCLMSISDWVACHLGVSFKIPQAWSRLNVDSWVALNSSLASLS